MTDEVTINVLEAPALKKTGTRVVIGVIPVGALVGRYTIPRRDFRHQSGYQREASQPRVNRLMADLRSGRVDLPTAVLLNLRDYDPTRHLVQDVGVLGLKLNGAGFYVVDGQHRIEALRRLVDEDSEKWSDFKLAFVCMLGADEMEEMGQFYVVNSTAKSVRTDLALDLLKQQAETDPEVMTGLIERSEDWKVRAESLVEQIAHTSPVWKGRLRFPGAEKGDTTITNAGMVTAVKGLLATPYFGQLNIENQVRILDAFWQGVRKVLPEAFDQPSDFVIQKQVGVQVMHGVLISIVEYVRSMGRSVVEAESFADAMNQALLNLEGDTREGDVARGVDFWRAGANGAAGSFSSNAGRRVLTAKIRAMLPTPTVE
jgi:DGQHR domain-containing protein